MAELPRVMAERFVRDYGLPEYDATQLTQSKAISAYFEATTRDCGQAKLASNWIMGEVSKYLNAVEDISFEEFQETVTPANLAALISRISDGTISNAAAKKVFSENLIHAPGTMHDSAIAYIDAIIEEKGLKQMNDTGALEKIVDEVIAANAKNVAEFNAGNDKALNALVGQIMKASKGTANPQQVNELLRAKLG
jgi:aspartyl-tRNA(Asn)/glutamyl-tRNA(Gln) amidotransferase subunit B